MACRWRIRHKLMFGLAFVVGIIALLLTGTLYGLASFRATMKSIESKHAEWNAAENVKVVVNSLNSDAGSRNELQRSRTAFTPRHWRWMPMS